MNNFIEFVDRQGWCVQWHINHLVEEYKNVPSDQKERPFAFQEGGLDHIGSFDKINPGEMVSLIYKNQKKKIPDFYEIRIGDITNEYNGEDMIEIELGGAHQKNLCRFRASGKKITSLEPDSFTWRTMRELDIRDTNIKTLSKVFMLLDPTKAFLNLPSDVSTVTCYNTTTIDNLEEIEKGNSSLLTIECLDPDDVE